MIRKAVAIFFTTLFMALIMAPSVIVVLDDSIDTSIFYSIAEEEENGKTKKLVSPFSLLNSDSIIGFKLKTQRFFSYQFKNYPKPHLNLISPPPEHIIL
ncbi:hypothetical protein [Mariniflexile sp. AS56]|uniref:hypothetical protein n=1 Tax=Mariniflexile sp. AS56 TaxID=3063957 RepID=UPI0026F2EC1E|nr:hypothetical protein [Mariniflexile sp. AS56]MDO7173484.1 hypothetical protein [Mariniflexile sp. AS56]